METENHLQIDSHEEHIRNELTMRTIKSETISLV